MCSSIVWITQWSPRNSAVDSRDKPWQNMSRQFDEVGSFSSFTPCRCPLIILSHMLKHIPNINPDVKPACKRHYAPSCSIIPCGWPPATFLVVSELYWLHLHWWKAVKCLYQICSLIMLRHSEGLKVNTVFGQSIVSPIPSISVQDFCRYEYINITPLGGTLITWSFRFWELCIWLCISCISWFRSAWAASNWKIWMSKA